MEYVKEKIEELDKDARKLKTETLDGGFLGILMKSYKSVVQVDEISPNSSVIHLSVEYEPISQQVVAHATPALHDSLSLGFTNLQSYLVAHPELYAD